MTILAGLSPVGALIVRAGEPKVLNISLAQADGTTPQNLQGRTFVLIVRRSSRTAPLFSIPAELSPDGLYVSVMMTAEQATAIYEAGYAQALSYDFVELSGGASTSRFTERVQVQVAPSLPSDIVPIWEMLPYTEAMIRPDVMVITERGAQGESRLLDYPVDLDALPVGTATEEALAAKVDEAVFIGTVAEIAADVVAQQEELSERPTNTALAQPGAADAIGTAKGPLSSVLTGTAPFILPERKVLNAAQDSTTDIFADLATAVNSGAKRIYVPTPEVGYYAKTANRNSPLTLPEGVILESETIGLTIDFDPLDGHGILNQNALIVAGGNKCGLINVGIDGGAALRSALAGFKAIGRTGIIIRDVVMTNVYSAGVLLTDCVAAKIRHCKVTGRAYASIRIDGDSNDIEITDFECHSDRGFGIYIHDTAHECRLSDIRSKNNALETVGVTKRAHRNAIEKVRSYGSGDNAVSITGYLNSVDRVHAERARYDGVCLYGQGNRVDNVTAIECGQANAGLAPAAMADYGAVAIKPAFGGIGRKNRVGENIVSIDEQDTPTMTHQVVYKSAVYAAHIPGEVIAANIDAPQYRTAGNILYVTTTGGTAGATTPTHTSGTVSDGGVSWTYLNAAIAKVDGSYPPLWGPTVVTAGQMRTHLFNRYIATTSGTPGATPPTHTTGIVSDGGVSWRLQEQYPSNLHPFDNATGLIAGTPGQKGYTLELATAADAGNKNMLFTPEFIQLGIPNRNLTLKIIPADKAPAANIFAPPGSIALRRDTNNNGLAIAAKDSQVGTAGWKQATLT